jgi:phosphoribosylformimino-5-aminoimidazole carboxamide ribotide isomerase
MILYPAIDLKDGQCVRLLKGDMTQATVFSLDPGAQAASFQEQGFKWLHIVDLNGAFEGKPVNSAAVNSILSSITIPAQLGGGIRSMETIAMWLEAGLSRVILGTVALRNPELVKIACREFPGKIAVGIDGRGGYVAVEGWAETSELAVTDLALQFEDAGVAAIIYTDINRDGLLGGPDVAGTKLLAENINTPVIASGGMSNIEDVRRIKALETSGVNGVILGRALYDGKINIAAALAIAAGQAAHA